MTCSALLDINIQKMLFKLIKESINILKFFFEIFKHILVSDNIH